MEQTMAEKCGIPSGSTRIKVKGLTIGYVQEKMDRGSRFHAVVHLGDRVNGTLIQGFSDLNADDAILDAIAKGREKAARDMDAIYAFSRDFSDAFRNAQPVDLALAKD